MYIAEITPGNVRGRFVSINQLTIVIGILAAQLINWRIARPVPPGSTISDILVSWNGQTGWRWMFYACIVPAGLFFILMWLVPEAALRTPGFGGFHLLQLHDFPGQGTAHTLGILCDPTHAVFKDFPTEFHTNWQWWDPISHSQVMIIDGFPANLIPLIQPIDTWFENRRLALAFEAKTNGGKLMVCSIDLRNISGDRLVSKQLLLSFLNYMNGDLFNPRIEVDISKVKELITSQK